MPLAGVRVAVRRLFARAGFEVARTKYATTFETVCKSLLTIQNPVVILDVGANVGQFGEDLRRLGYGGKIVSFEPLPDAHGALVSRAAHDSRWVVAPRLALGAQSGEATMNVASNSVSSSLLPMLDSHLRSAPDSAYRAAIQVKVDRLDAQVDLLAQDSPPWWLKIDTQGFEKEVLLGARGVLPGITMIQVELSLVPLYEGAPTFSEMVSLIEKLGFEIFSLVPGFRDQVTGRLLQMDGFFTRIPGPAATPA